MSENANENPSPDELAERKARDERMAALSRIAQDTLNPNGLDADNCGVGYMLVVLNGDGTPPEMISNLADLKLVAEALSYSARLAMQLHRELPVEAGGMLPSAAAPGTWLN